MSSLDQSRSLDSAASAPAAGTPAPSPHQTLRSRSFDDDLPSVMSVMCPVAFTPSSTEGLSLDTPLFARVTYRVRT